ncbi:MAG: sigma-54 interaction domain-containing protein [Syntrophobacteraceae bacterium]
MRSPDKNSIESLMPRVFSSRDLEYSINEIYKFLRKILPIDLMTLPIYDSLRGTLRYMALVTDEGVICSDETVVLSGPAQEYAQAVQTSGENILCTDTHQSPVVSEVQEHLGIEEPGSALVLITALGADKFGLLGLFAFGPDRYNTEHIRRFEEIYEPTAGAVRHILSRLEIESLKELLVVENREIRRRLGHRVLGAQTGLKEVMTLVDQAAPLDVPVLLTGETGTGKEIIANAIHQRSNRAEGPLVSVNCGAIPETLLDSELFGYEKGAFTGAASLKKGYFEQADLGSIFLDEIGELAPQAQVKLLRVLQTGTFRRVGGTRPISTDARVIAATNRDLKQMVDDQKFRADLWFRLNVFPIHIPPLRQRKMDVPAFANHFLRSKSLEMNLPFHSRFAPGAINVLQRYDWPGNVRELQNVIERALITSRGEPIAFPKLVIEEVAAVDRTTPKPPGRYLTMDEMIDRYIREILVVTKGKISGKGGAAELLAMNPSTLRARMRKLGINMERLPESR